ncbi:GMC oxidoreductase-domain-containing protein [Mycena sanguinolenta]|nr:GMC oxidoreductase-domain-containing protein [Mycena sanguinolenta]
MYGSPQKPAFINTILNLTGISHFKDINGGTSNAVSVEPSRSKLQASGVEFASSTNSTARFTALARREVIITGGAIQTEIDLKTVGRNLQEQAIAKGSQIQSSLATWATSQAASGLSAAALQTVFGVQANLIKKNGNFLSEEALVVELFYDSGFPDDLDIDMWQLLPFSRGNVKITSADPFTAPAIRANYFSVELDLDVQAAGSRLSRRILTSPPLKPAHPSILAIRWPPGSKVPDDATRGSDVGGQTWIKNGFASVAHPIGTDAMMRRSLGGVVDAQLKVYDTANVRVVDASVVPLQLSAHLSSTLYGVAEKAADLIKAAQ